MSLLPPPQDENLYWKPDNIMPTHQAKQLLFPSSSLAWSDRYFAQGPALLPPFLHKRTCLPGHARLELRMANCVGHCVGIIEDINQDDVLKCWSEYRSSSWHKNVRYLPRACSHQNLSSQVEIMIMSFNLQWFPMQMIVILLCTACKAEGSGGPQKNFENWCPEIAFCGPFRATLTR